MSTTVNLYSRDGSKLLFNVTFEFNMSQGGVFFDTNTGVATLKLSGGGVRGEVSWMPNTSAFAGFSSNPNTTQAEFPVTNTDTIILWYTPIWNIYEAYEGNEAFNNGYKVTFETEQLAAFIGQTPIYNVIYLPSELPQAVRGTPSGLFISTRQWFYDEFLLNEAYPNDEINNDVYLYYKFGTDVTQFNIYNSSGTVLKASNYTEYAVMNLFLVNSDTTATLSAGTTGEALNISWETEADKIFKGLSTEPNGIVFISSPQAINYFTSPRVIDFYEVYEDIPVTTTHTITYVTNGGTLEDNYPNPETNLYTIPEYLPTCVKDGNLFDGWYYDANFNEPVVLGAALTDDINLYAKFISLLTIDIVLYQNKSENNRVNKKPYLTKVMTMQGTFRQSVSILAPTITIEAENLPQFNYIYISAFGRYYFVNSITSVNTSVWQISTSCDVLYSYANTIRSQVAYIARNENEYNLNITDNTFNLNLPTSTNKTLVTLTKDAGWIPYDKTFYTDAHKRGVILMQGFLTDRNENILQNSFGLSCIISRMDYTQQFLSVACQNTVDWLSSKLMSDLIVSAKAFPFNIPTNNIEVGYWKMQTLLGVHNTLVQMGGNKHYTPTKKYLIDSVWEFEIRKPHSSLRENYLNYNPYTTVFIEFLPYGRFEIDTKLLFRTGDTAKLIITARTNVITGESALYWKTGSMVTEVEYYLGTANVAMDIPFSGTASSTQKFVSGVATIGATVATAAAMASGGGIGAAGAIGLAMSAMGGASQITEAVTSPITTVSGGTYSIIDQTPKVLVETKQLSGTSYSTLGSPLFAERKLNTLTGFTNVVSVNLQGFNTATAAEVSEIEQHLKTGVIL